MNHKSTIDRIRSLVDDIVSSYNPDDAASAAREVRALLDTLVPPHAANPVDAALVALDYGTDRDWPADAVELVARLLPEMKIATAWPVDGEPGRSRWFRHDAATGQRVGVVGSSVMGWRVAYPRSLPARSTLRHAQAESDALSLAEGYTLVGGAVVVQEVTATITGPVSSAQDRFEMQQEITRGERFAVYQRHDWPVANPSVCRRCGLIRERRGNAHIYHEGDARWRRPAGECRIQVEPKPQEQV